MIIFNKRILFLKKTAHRISPKLLPIFHKIKGIILAKSIQRETKNDIKEFFVANEREKQLFNYVEIETLNRCNGTCSFCGVNRNDDPRPLAKMSDETFRKIIDNLVKLNFCGMVSYYSNNEPLMDNRIIDFIKYGVSMLPNVAHNISTNGILLNNKIFQALIDSRLNYLTIDNYNNHYVLNSNIQKIYDEYKTKSFSLFCRIAVRTNNQPLSNRGGTAPNKQILKNCLNAPCYYPFHQLIIRADGGVSLCCNDALGQITLGNVEKQTLEDIWFSEKHFNILKLISDSRDNIKICSECDIIKSKNRCVFLM
jgi:radical SAM protein with 4Fe4S-binding SPASM domain